MLSLELHFQPGSKAGLEPEIAQLQESGQAVRLLVRLGLGDLQRAKRTKPERANNMNRRVWT